LPGKKEGVDGLKDRHKSGRPSKLPLEIAVKIKKKLKESKQGWTTTKQVNEMIVKDGSEVRYHHIYIYTLLHKWGFKQKVPRKVHVNTASEEEKEGFKKERRKY
jgi:putative transposase